MPNHVRNVLKFKNLKTKDRDYILNNFTTEMEDDIFPLNKIFDFDKIIPEPRLESECPDDCKVNKDSHIMEDAKRPWFDWYAWRNKYWNTKWGAYDGYVKVGTSTITFVFSTAWSAPYPIYEKLAKDFKYDFEVKYADEDWGSNCGWIKFKSEHGFPAGYEDNYENSAFKNPYRWAREFWRQW